MATMMRPAILAMMLMLGACSRSDDGTDNSESPVALVVLGHAEQAAVRDTVTLYGAAEAGASGSLALTAPADANVARIVAPVGTRVSRGAIVAELAPAPNTRVDIAKSAADARAADAALARARRLRADGLVGDAEVETARAAAQGADAARSALSGQAGGLTLRAPRDGIVQSVSVSPGDRVQASAAVATIARPGDLRARFGVDPSVARALRPGAAVRIEAIAGRAAFTAPIQSVDPVVDPQTRLGSIFVVLPTNAGLAIGETLTASVAVSANARALTIPYSALLDDGGQPYVYVVADGVAHRHDIRIGTISGDRIAIEGGIRAGDAVVIQGGTALEDGMKVRTR